MWVGAWAQYRKAAGRDDLVVILAPTVILAQKKKMFFAMKSQVPRPKTRKKKKKNEAFEASFFIRITNRENAKAESQAIDATRHL